MEESTSKTSPPPSGEGRPRATRELRRSRDNRVVAGVAAGIGHYFDIDPVIVRIGFIVLTVFGGSGILLYLIAWLVMAKEGDDESAAARALKGSDQTRSRGVVAILLILAAVFMIGGPVLWLADLGFGGEGLFFPMLLIAAGIALLLWPDDADWSSIRPQSGPSAGPPAPSEPASRPEPEEAEPIMAADTEPTSTALVPTSSALAEVDDLDEFEELPPSPGEPPIDTMIVEPPEEPDEVRRRSFPITSLTMAVLLVMTGGAVLLDRLDVIEVRPVTYLAAALVVVGLGLVASAFVGRARGLIVLGLLILPVLWFAHVVDIEWWSGVGDERIVVDDVADLEPVYHHGIGQLVVDLRQLDLEGETANVEIGLTIGNLEVVIPDDAEVNVDLDGRIGQVVVERPGRDLTEDGMDIEVDTTIPGDNGRLNLDIDVGIGEARVGVSP